MSVENLAARLSTGEDWRVPLGEFLDGFYRLWPDREAMAAALATSPDAVLPPLPEALLAATVEQLAAQWGVPCPPWAAKAGYGLVQPLSLGPAWMPPSRLPNPPGPFRNRLLHVDPDPLRRARRPPLPPAQQPDRDADSATSALSLAKGGGEVPR